MGKIVYLIHEADGGLVEFRLDPLQAASKIEFRLNEDIWQDTPLQCADAGHDPHRAAELLEDWFSSEGGGAGEVSWVEESAPIAPQCLRCVELEEELALLHEELIELQALELKHQEAFFRLRRERDEAMLRTGVAMKSKA